MVNCHRIIETNMEPTASEVHPSGLYWSLWWLVSFRWLYNVIRILWIIANNLYVIPAYFAWMVIFSPIFLVSPSIYWGIEDVLFGWLLNMVACWNHTAGYSVVESGDRVPLEQVSEDNILFMPNHQSTADVPLCMTLFTARSRFADRVMWIMDRIFKYSNFGCVSWMHDDFFILAGKENRDASLVALRSHLQNAFVKKRRKYIVLFPEGGFLRKRKPISQKFAKKNDLPMLEHCTLPRTGALEIILEVLGDKTKNGGGAMNNGLNNSQSGHAINKICDVTIAYPEGKPLDLFQIAAGYREPCATHVHYRLFDVKDLPQDAEDCKTWMYNLYAEKDRMLEQYYQTGSFPHDMYPPATTSTASDEQQQQPRGPKLLHHDPLKFLLLHLFFLASSLVMVWSFLKIKSFFW